MFREFIKWLFGELRSPKMGTFHSEYESEWSSSGYASPSESENSEYSE